MQSIKSKKPYSCVVIFKNTRDKSDFQLLAYRYAQLLKQLGAESLTATSREKFELTYPIQKVTDVKFVEFKFNISPKVLVTFKKRLSLDDSVLRSFLTVGE